MPHGTRRRIFPDLTPALERELNLVPPSLEPVGGLAYKPCQVTLADGTVVDNVYIQEAGSYIRVWGLWPDEDPGKTSVDVAEVVHIRESRNRLPARFAEQLYQAGESSMGGCTFTVVFADETRQVYHTGNALDFIPYPAGKTAGDVVEVLPHQGRGERTALRGCRYSWCLYGAGEPTVASPKKQKAGDIGQR